jgi:hypothetical protein
MTKFEQKIRLYGERLQKDLGISVEQAAGIFGNLSVETGGFTLLQEKNPIVAGSRGGYGWMQWTGPRRRAYEAWAQANNLNPADDETNYRYLVKETMTDEKASLSALKRTTSPETAAKSFCEKNLRPGIPHIERRQTEARKAYDILMKKTAPVVAEKTVVATPGKGAGTAVVVTGIGTAVASQSPMEYVPYIIAGTLLLAVIAWVLVRVTKRSKEQKVAETPTVEVKKEAE